MVYSRPMSKTVLFFCGEHSDVALRKYAGICAFGQRRKWNVRFIHYRDGELSFRDALATWRPDGIISDRAAFASERATGVPTVFIDAGKDLARRIWPGVYHDPRAAARLAAAEFARLGLTRRESTRCFYGRATELRSSRNLIYREACRGLRARDVFAQMKGSRRSAEIRFKAATGRTVREEIKNVRLRLAKRLLQTTTLSLAEIAAKCGYQSSSHLRKVFAKRMKTTMGAWRKAHRADVI